MLSIDSKESGDQVVFKLAGTIDEHASLKDLQVTGKRMVVFDLEGVRLINSIGIRDWMVWMRKQPHDRNFVFRNCPKPIIDQINILNGFLPVNAVIESFFVPYVCDTCEKGAKVLFKNGAEFSRGTADAQPQINVPRGPDCPDCRRAMSLDVVETQYFSFLRYRRD